MSVRSLQASEAASRRVKSREPESGSDDQLGEIIKRFVPIRHAGENGSLPRANVIRPAADENPI
jgi:hypothetical protein